MSARNYINAKRKLLESLNYDGDFDDVHIVYHEDELWDVRNIAVDEFGKTNYEDASVYVKSKTDKYWTEYVYEMDLVYKARGIHAFTSHDAYTTELHIYFNKNKTSWGNR